eukprot:COSAG06_NODE_655_length_13338_cov_12.493013_7_plen_192_part_00
MHVEWYVTPDARATAVRARHAMWSDTMSRPPGGNGTCFGWQVGSHSNTVRDGLRRKGVAWRRQHTTTGTANNNSPSEAALTESLRPHATAPVRGPSAIGERHVRHGPLEGQGVGANLVDGLLDATDLFDQESHHRHHRRGGLLLTLFLRRRWTRSSRRLLPTTATRGPRGRRLSYHATVGVDRKDPARRAA